MIKRKLLAAFLVFTSILLAFSGPRIIQNALAQPQNPPTSSSMGDSIPAKALPETNILVADPGPATDDYTPETPSTAQDVQSAVPYQDFGIESDSWVGSIPHGVRSDSIQGGMQTQATVLYDNGPLVTHPGGGYNGYDASALQASLGMSIIGYGTSNASGYHLSDDFTIPSPTSWQIDDITLYMYQSGTYSNPPVSTITHLYLQIWDGSPDNPGSSIVFGDLVTNRLIDTYWTSIYRVLDLDLVNTARPIIAAVVDIDITLPPGTYWLEYTAEGSLGSGPFTAPISILGQTTTGNAMQYSSGGWEPANDAGTGTQQGMPFVIEGTVGDWLWDQPLSATQFNTYVDQEFPDYPNLSTYLADDFVVDETWKIDRIFVPGDGWNGFFSLVNAAALNWAIYADNGGIPAGDPSGTGSAPVWSATYVPTSPNVTLSSGHLGYLSNTLLQLPTPLKLAPGHYWLLFYPTLEFASGGQFGLQPADTNNGEIAKLVNPGNGFGYGTEWQDWSVIGAPTHDIAFSIGGTSGYSWKSISAINSTGRSRPAAATVNGKIYLFGGEISGGGRADTVERYDPSTNTWTTLAGVMPYPASNICAAVIGTDIYIPGGWGVGSTYLDTLQVFHTTTNSWSVVTTDPLADGAYGIGCATLNNKLYVFGGDVSGTPQASAYVYNPAAAAGSRWSSLASRNAADAFLGAATINGKIYTLGGYYCPDCFEVYDPADGLWHVAPKLKASRGGAGVYGVGTNLYACGGGWATFLDTCESYDTNQGYSGAWQAYPSIMIEGRRTFGYANIGPVMYAIAGWRNGYMQSAERWSFDAYLPLTIK